MPNIGDKWGECQQFYGRLEKNSHGRVHPCYMTGERCTYIDRIAATRRVRWEGGIRSGFVVMPFRAGFRVQFQNCLRPFFEHQYSTPDGLHRILLDNADEATSPWVVVPSAVLCEGVCKRIQEADFVVADVSVPNDNVFYELGLAYGIGHKILVVYHRLSEFGRGATHYLGCTGYAYEALAPIFDLMVSEYLWVGPSDGLSRLPSGVLYLEMMSSEHLGSPGRSAVIDRISNDIEVGLAPYLASHLHLAIDRIVRRCQDGAPSCSVPVDILPRTLERAHPDAPFRDIRDRIDGSYCVIIRTGKQVQPISYFWLGYAHARGKNVIPLTAVEIDEQGGQRVADLAFDLRAQRHMIFNPQQPEIAGQQLERTLESMLLTDLPYWFRKHFWDQILGSQGELSIFTGAFQNDEMGQMIREWDLRSASELISYFSRNKYLPTLEPPVYQPESSPDVSVSGYIQHVIEACGLASKNCIVVGSPDINPLTEITLGRLYGIDDKDLFRSTSAVTRLPDSVVVYKQRGVKSNLRKLNRMLFQEEVGDDSPERRGLISQIFPGGAVILPHLRNSDEPFAALAHLVVAKNPFSPLDDPVCKYVIILNGVSSIATYTLTQAITGGVYGDLGSASELVLEKILPHLLRSDFRAVQCVIRVFIRARTHELGPYDRRVGKKWELYAEVLGDNGVVPF